VCTVVVNNPASLRDDSMRLHLLLDVAAYPRQRLAIMSRSPISCVSCVGDDFLLAVVVLLAGRRFATLWIHMM
jgi:hypothetical protein